MYKYDVEGVRRKIMNAINIEISNTEYRELIHKSATFDMILEAWEYHTYPEDFEMDTGNIIDLYYKEIKTND